MVYSTSKQIFISLFDLHSRTQESLQLSSDLKQFTI